jgi:hypothetical protein
MTYRIITLFFAALLFLGCAKVDSPKLNPVVKKLRSVETRDAAFREIISWQKYKEEDPAYHEKEAKHIEHVVECPQPDGSSIFSVFFAQKGKPRGHIILIDSDGTIIPFYSNANSIHGIFRDVNGDGVVENVEHWRYGDKRCVDLLHVIQITPDPWPILRVAYNRGQPEEKWSWEAIESNTPRIFDIVLGPTAKDTGKVVPKVVYKWSDVNGKYEGPLGGMDMPFIRVDGDRGDLLSDYLHAKEKE